MEEEKRKREKIDRYLETADPESGNRRPEGRPPSLV
jgi:hypothetical protein